MAASLIAGFVVFLEAISTPAWAQDRLARSDCDVAMMAVGILPARQARVDFSRPYLASPVYGVTTKDGMRISRWSDIDTPGR